MMVQPTSLLNMTELWKMVVRLGRRNNHQFLFSNFISILALIYMFDLNRYKLSDDTLFHQETHNVQVGEELVPVSSGKYSYRTAKGLFTVNWTADREHGFVATETFEDK